MITPKQQIKPLNKELIKAILDYYGQVYYTDVLAIVSQFIALISCIKYYTRRKEDNDVGIHIQKNYRLKQPKLNCLSCFHYYFTYFEPELTKEQNLISNGQSSI